MKFNFPIVNFSSGEWSPYLKGRADIQAYSQSCEEMTNFLPLATGGAQYRAGARSIYMGAGVSGFRAALDAGDPTKMHAFQYTGTGPRTSGQLVFTGNTSNPVYFVRYSRSGGVSSATAITVNYGRGGSTGAGTHWFITSNGSATTAGFTSTHKWHHTQVGEYLVLARTDGAHPPMVYYQLIDGTHVFTDWQDFTVRREGVSVAAGSRQFKGIPWSEPYALDSYATATPSAVGSGGPRTVTFSQAIVTSAKFNGTLIRFCSGTLAEGVFQMDTINTTSILQGQNLNTLPAAGAYGGVAAPTTFWQNTLWGDGPGFPRTVTSYQERLIFGGTPTYPNRIWGSRAGNITDFQNIPSPDTTGIYSYADQKYLTENERAFDFTLTNVDEIVSLSAGKVLTVFGKSNETVMFGTDGALSPINVQTETTTNYGAINVQAVRALNTTVFVSGNGLLVRDTTYNFNEDQYVVSTMNFLADHLFTGTDTAKDIDAPKYIVPVSRDKDFLFFLTEQGRMYCMTRNKELGTIGWSRVAINDGSSTQTPPYEDAAYVAAACPGIDGESVFMLVREGSRTHLCDMTLPYTGPNPFLESVSYTDYEPVFLDFQADAEAVGAVPTATWTTNITGTGDRYSGKTVSVIADGIYVGEFTAGTLNLPFSASHVVVGYKYKGVLKTMPIEQGGQYGAPMGRHKRIDEMLIRFYRTVGCKYGKSQSDLYEIPFRENSQLMGDPTDYFTGDKVVTFPPGYERDIQVVIEQNLPFPCYILAIVPRGMTYD